jgi:hypothetical protein
MSLALLYHATLSAQVYGGSSVPLEIMRVQRWTPGVGEVAPTSTSLVPNGILYPTYATLIDIPYFIQTSFLNPVLVSLIPVILFQAYRRYVSDRAALLGAAIFMFAHPFFVGAELNSRESTLFLYNRLEEALRDPLNELIPDDQQYAQTFEKLEMVSDMVIVDLFEVIHEREIDYPRSRYWELRLEEEIEAKSEDWEPLQAGLFGGDLDRVEKVVEKYRH